MPSRITEAISKYDSKFSDPVGIYMPYEKFKQFVQDHIEKLFDSNFLCDKDFVIVYRDPDNGRAIPKGYIYGLKIINKDMLKHVFDNIDLDCRTKLFTESLKRENYDKEELLLYILHKATEYSISKNPTGYGSPKDFIFLEFFYTGPAYL